MPTVESKIVDIEAVILFENKAGTAIKIDDGKTSAWLPKNLVEDYGDGTLAMPRWLALEKGLI
jgi:hypothetical protein